MQKTPKNFQAGFTPLENHRDNQVIPREIRPGRNRNVFRNTKRRNFQTGFTLIELIITVAIIGILASIVMVSLTNAQKDARDARRKAELANVATALNLYYIDNGTFAIANAGSGGTGWFNYNYGASLGSVASALKTLGYMSGEALDPSGIAVADGVTQAGYMIYADTTGFTLWADLERPTATDLATQSTCRFDVYDSYWSGWPAAARTNYCISN
jgi:prepilin-type N-terminal cleavage/methylation domain-containing protein